MVTPFEIPLTDGPITLVTGSYVGFTNRFLTDSARLEMGVAVVFTVDTTRCTISCTTDLVTRFTSLVVIWTESVAAASTLLVMLLADGLLTDITLERVFLANRFPTRCTGRRMVGTVVGIAFGTGDRNFRTERVVTVVTPNSIVLTDGGVVVRTVDDVVLADVVVTDGTFFEMRLTVHIAIDATRGSVVNTDGPITTRTALAI